MWWGAEALVGMRRVGRVGRFPFPLPALPNTLRRLPPLHHPAPTPRTPPSRMFFGIGEIISVLANVRTGALSVPPRD